MNNEEFRQTFVVLLHRAAQKATRLFYQCVPGVLTANLLSTLAICKLLRFSIQQAVVRGYVVAQGSEVAIGLLTDLEHIVREALRVWRATGSADAVAAAVLPLNDELQQRCAQVSADLLHIAA